MQRRQEDRLVITDQVYEDIYFSPGPHLTPAAVGTSSAPLAYAPDWMLNLFAIRPQLQKLAEQIEKGEPALMPGYQSQAEWEPSLSPEEQREVQEYRQDEAARPSVNPDADAQRYLNGT